MEKSNSIKPVARINTEHQYEAPAVFQAGASDQKPLNKNQKSRTP